MNLSELESRVLVVADDPLARAGLAALLADVPGLAVVGRVAGDSNLAADLDLYRPDVVVWDLGWATSSEGAGIQAVVEIIAELIETGLPLVVLVSSPEAASALWAAGARGLLLRDSSVERLTAALSAVLEGLSVVEPALMDGLVSPPPLPGAAPAEQLTPREMEVLQRLAEGYSNRAIAHQLDISEHTVKFHVNAIMTKLNAQSRTEAVVRATRLGLISL